MLLFARPIDAGSNRDRFCAELPPCPMCKKVTTSEQRDGFLQAFDNGALLWKAERVIFSDGFLYPFGSLVCGPSPDLRALAETGNARDGVQKISDPALKSSVREHHPDESSRKRLKVRIVRVRKVVRCPRSPGHHVDGGEPRSSSVNRGYLSKSVTLFFTK
jgi:hypothetical protein